MKKIIKNKKINLFNVLVFIFVLIYVIFGTDVIKDIKNVKIGDTINTKLKNGNIISKVINKESGE